MFCSYLLRERIVSFLGQVSYEDQIKLSARVESLGTALASTTLQAKPVWARGKAKQVPQCIYLVMGGKVKVHSSSPFQ